MYRLATTGIVLMWLAAMGALIAHDMWPVWTAQDPPAMTPEQLAELADTVEQCRIIRKDGSRLGTVWRDITRVNETTVSETWIRIEPVKGLPAFRIQSKREFNAAGELDSFSMNIHDTPFSPVEAYGERNGPYIACRMQVGHHRRTARLDASSSGMIGETMNPFSALPELAVGQRWRMQTLDPMTAAFGRPASFRAVIAEVTGKETITSPLTGDDKECFVVEIKSQKAKAWVTDEGEVLRQTVEMPVLGTVTVEAEEFDEAAYEKTRGKNIEKKAEASQASKETSGSADE